ncbi:MAG: DUF2914 domain-containing protein, partial [Calditrichia bacterium]
MIHKKSLHLEKTVKIYDRYRKFLPVVSFTGGFLWDSLTLTRIDRLSDNLILMAYIILLGLALILVNLHENGRLQSPFLLKYSEWYPLGVQFFLGGLFSSYVVFYFQSASLTKDWLFLAILIFLLLANEFFEKRLTNLYLQTILYSVVTFSFFIFFIPVVIGRIGVFVFLLSGLVALLFIAGLILLLNRTFKIITPVQRRNIIGLVAGLFLILNIFYFLNWIPPVPLALKSGGIYHHVVRSGNDYLLSFEKPAWYQFRKSSDNPFRYAEGDSVFCFAAVFAPTHLNTEIFHFWQHYDSRKQKWETTDRLGYAVTGGRKEGYRGFTFKRN